MGSGNIAPCIFLVTSYRCGHESSQTVMHQIGSPGPMFSEKICENLGGGKRGVRCGIGSVGIVRH